jgi:hypothetical protein
LEKKLWKIELEAKINIWVIECNFLLFKEKGMFQCPKIISNHRVLKKNEVDSYGGLIFAPDDSDTILAAKVCTKSNEHSIYVRCLWFAITVLLHCGIIGIYRIQIIEVCGVIL